MLEIYEIVSRLQETTKRNKKESILREAVVSQNFDFFIGLQLAYNPLVTFGVKELLDRDKEDTLGHGHNFKDFIKLTTELRHRRLTGGKAKEEIQLFANGVDEEEWDLFYAPILRKDMRCGISDKTINKVLKELSKEEIIELPEYVKQDVFLAKVETLKIPVFSCALAIDSNKHPEKLTGKVFIDEKHDGIRLLAVLNASSKEVILYTRNGQINNNFPKIEEELKKWFKRGLAVSVVLDGEVVSKNFQTLMTQVNRKEAVNTEDSIYHLFDIINMDDFFRGGTTVSQAFRHGTLQSQFSAFATSGGPIKVLPKKMVNLSTQEGDTEYKEFYNVALARGLEGIMIKSIDAPYKCTRNSNWLKLKPTFTLDLEIMSMSQGTGKNKGKLGYLVCQGRYNRKTLKTRVGGGFSDELRDLLWKNKDEYIGGIVEIKADAVTVNQKGETSLRFPRFVRFRGTKEEGKI